MQIVYRLLFFLLSFCGSLWSQEVASIEALDNKLAEHIHFDLNGPNRIGYLSIGRDHPIDQSTYLYVKFALEHDKKKGVCFILLDLNTPGGEVFSALKIVDLLHQIDEQDHIPVVAFIDNWALSAGAMLAYGCRFIGIVKSASMGAAEPVLIGRDGKGEMASEKIRSALRAEFANLASYYGRDPLLAEAMVDKEMIVVLRKGQVVRLEEESQVRMGKDADSVIARKGKLLTLNAGQLIDLKVADFLVLPHPLIPLTEQELAEGKWPAAKSLLFQQSFFKKIPQAEILSFGDWRIGVFAFLNHPLISSLLFIGLVLGVYLEMSHPGFGVAGIMAAVCLGLILLSSFAVETVDWLELIILGAGIVLLVVEVAILPGFGLTGILGILLILFGLFSLMLPNLDQVHFSWDLSQLNLATIAFLERLSYLCAAFVISVVIIGIIARFVSPRLIKMSRMVLTEDQEGYVASQFELSVIGKIGVVVTELKPAGHIAVDGKHYQALSESGFVSKGKKVLIVGGKGAHLIVKEEKYE